MTEIEAWRRISELRRNAGGKIAAAEKWADHARQQGIPESVIDNSLAGARTNARRYLTKGLDEIAALGPSYAAMADTVREECDL